MFSMEFKTDGAILIKFLDNLRLLSGPVIFDSVQLSVSER